MKWSKNKSILHLKTKKGHNKIQNLISIETNMQQKKFSQNHTKQYYLQVDLIHIKIWKEQALSLYMTRI